MIKIYQNCCKKCGSISLHTEVKGNNTGLYCDDCGSWIKWIGKDELRAFEHGMKDATKEERESIEKYIENISKPTGGNFFSDKTIIDRLQEFVVFLDTQIDKELTREPLSVEDSISKCSYAHAYEKDKNALLNIIAGRDWNNSGE